MAYSYARTLCGMARNHRSNPYIKLTAADVYRACQDRAGELMEPGGSRTREERAELAIDTAYLLLAVARYVDSGEHTPGSPEQEMRDPRADLADVFGKYHDQLAKTIRYQVLIRATEIADGSAAVSGDVYNRALASADGLREVLAELDEQYRERRAKNR